MLPDGSGSRCSPGFWFCSVDPLRSAVRSLPVSAWGSEGFEETEKLPKYFSVDGSEHPLVVLGGTVSPVCCCRASRLSSARCRFCSIRRRCSSVREGGAGAGAGVEWTGPGGSVKEAWLMTGSGSWNPAGSSSAPGNERNHLRSRVMLISYDAN